MQPSDRKAFLEVVVGFAELKGKQLSAPALELYWNAMQGWTIEDFRKAAAHLLQTCEFMPTPKDFNDLKKAAMMTEGEAWAAVMKHLKGGYRSGGLTPEIDRAVAACGGYRSLAMMDSEKLTFQERRFAQHYGDMNDVVERRAAIGYDPLPKDEAARVMKRLGGSQ